MAQEKFIPIPESDHPPIRKKQLYFLHGYDPQYWEGLAQHGFLDAYSGVKITQTYSTPSSLQFNAIAAINSPLHHRIQTEKVPLYIDRLQGGTYYFQYSFDLILLQHY